jgi:hypothetical protein
MRNVQEDLRRVFGEAIDENDAIAIMTDADDHTARALTYYGDIWFSVRNDGRRALSPRQQIAAWLPIGARHAR